MTPSDKFLRGLAVACACSWLTSLALSPSCRPQFWVGQALAEVFGVFLAAPVALGLLILHVLRAREKASVKLNSRGVRVLALALLWSGVVGAAVSLGCAQLEAAWPTVHADPYGLLANAPSDWKKLGLWLMGAGVGGLLAVLAKPPKR